MTVVKLELVMAKWEVAVVKAGMAVTKAEVVVENAKVAVIKAKQRGGTELFNTSATMLPILPTTGACPANAAVVATSVLHSDKGGSGSSKGGRGKG